MAKERKCILCETVHDSKQEMDEHMRSMLHHRELEKLKGRDCGHECRVCKVTVVSLTDYASHISSPTHKQKVEAAEQKQSSHGREEDYFDQALVDLIEKRKEQIRKEKEAAAAKLAKEEEQRRRQEELQQRLKEAKERYRFECYFKQSPQGFSGPAHQNSWYANGCSNGSRERAGEAPPPWPHSRQGKSATWHAQEPPNFQRWDSGNFQGRDGWSGSSNGNRWDGRGGFHGNQQNRLPWLSNGGSSYGVYGRNNISQKPQRGRPQSLMGRPLAFPPAQHIFFDSDSQPIQSANSRAACQRQTPEPDLSSKSSKTLGGNNPKQDKACRWTPYPTGKNPESAPHKDVGVSEKFPRTSPESGASKGPGPKPSLEEKGNHKVQHTKGSDDQKDETQNSASNKLVKLKVPKKASQQKLSKVPAQTLQAQTASTKQSGVTPLLSRKELQLPERLSKAKPAVMEKRGSLESCRSIRMEAAPQEPPQRDVNQGRSGIPWSKENGFKQSAAKPNMPEKPALSCSESSQFLQSLHVSTSQEPDVDQGKREETETAAPDEAVQAADAGQSSESDTSRGGGDTQPSASTLSRLDLPNALKRDLTKHISAKGKAGSHEPNLHIARRVRNVSESRRTDTEKESGLKPTVRQLISSSGSRRNVNWEQVYQEVRKKQDKGKGMPRFGIEMVPFDQEDQSQEEDDIALLEGFQWESMDDASTGASSRKRSLSESSVAPGPSRSLFTAMVSEETSRREEPEWKLPGFSSSAVSPPGSKGAVEQMFSQFKIKTEKQDSDLGAAAAVRAPPPPPLPPPPRADSALGDSSSGTEQWDGHGAGKRRRAAADVPSAETSCVEHNSKRRKVKSKKERLQIDQLLTVSLREEELSRSLQTVDSSLIQARAALEAAYMEVQRLMVVKQQVTDEMSALRNKRIELLKGMQDSREVEPQLMLKEERMDMVDIEPRALPSSSSSSSSSSVTVSSPLAPPPRAERSPPPSPPSSCLPLQPQPVVIKQEPQSPVHVSPDPSDPIENIMALCAHSTTPELAAAPAAAPPTDLAAAVDKACQKSPAASPASILPLGAFHPSPERKPELYHVKTEDQWESFTELAATVDKACQKSAASPDSKAFILPLGAVACSAPQAFDVPPTSPPELRSGKRVRKLKKRKVLKKAQGAEQPPESSDTEQDVEAALRPRWQRPQRRRPSGSSQVSTSTQPSDERDEANMEVAEDGFRPPLPPARPQKHSAAAAELTLNLDSEENMEVGGSATELQQQPVQTQVPDSSRPEPQSLACNEVTSTSDMDVCKSSDSDVQSLITQPKTTKISSDASSDHGEDDLPTEGAFEGHQEAVNAMQIHNGLLYTCSGDRTVRAFDLVSHKCVAVFEGHSSKVSCLLVSAAPCLHHRLYTGSSDQTIRCYSLKTRELEQQFSLSDRVLCLHSRWKFLYAGMANGTVVTFNLKTNKQADVFDCHGPRGVSCLASSQEGARRILLIGSYDSTISVRDAKNGLLLRTLAGHTKTVLCMKVVNDLVFSGSSDQCVYAHNIHTGELLQVYKGHSHAVTVVSVLGKVMVTACLDKMVRVYDLQSHEQLQVYGGHKDMVMCMDVHKNMIYTGCYDGSVQAIKLNLMQNYRCWWHGCSLVFGLMEHLHQHLVSDHHSSRCRWKNCEEFLCARSASKQAVLAHMQKHAEEETQVEP